MKTLTLIMMMSSLVLCDINGLNLEKLQEQYDFIHIEQIITNNETTKRLFFKDVIKSNTEKTVIELRNDFKSQPTISHIPVELDTLSVNTDKGKLNFNVNKNNGELIGTFR